MWLLGPLCLLLSSAAGEWGARSEVLGARGTVAGFDRPLPARGPRLRAWVCTEGGPRRRAGRDPARGRGGVRAVLLCGRARRWRCCVCARAGLCVQPGSGEPGHCPDWA
jgi:hypothetical protein